MHITGSIKIICRVMNAPGTLCPNPLIIKSLDIGPNYFSDTAYIKKFKMWMLEWHNTSIKRLPIVDYISSVNELLLWSQLRYYSPHLRFHSKHTVSYWSYYANSILGKLLKQIYWRDNYGTCQKHCDVGLWYRNILDMLTKNNGPH